MLKQNHDCCATQGAPGKKPTSEQLAKNIDKALADPKRHMVGSSYIANCHHVTTYFVCNVVNGRCEVCGADKCGHEGCISFTRAEPICPEIDSKRTQRIGVFGGTK